MKNKTILFIINNIIFINFYCNKNYHNKL